MCCRDQGKSRWFCHQYKLDKWKNTSQRTITTVSVNGLEEPECNPNVHGEYMKVPHEEGIQQRSEDCSGGEDQHLRGVGILCREPEWCRIFMMDLVDVLI